MFVTELCLSLLLGLPPAHLGIPPGFLTGSKLDGSPKPMPTSSGRWILAALPGLCLNIPFPHGLQLEHLSELDHFPGDEKRQLMPLCFPYMDSKTCEWGCLWSSERKIIKGAPKLKKNLRGDPAQLLTAPMSKSRQTASGTQIKSSGWRASGRREPRPQRLPPAPSLWANAVSWAPRPLWKTRVFQVFFKKE